MKSKYSTKFFPFSAGIPWKIKNKKYLVPEMEKEIWDNVLLNKNLVVLAYGGLIESFFSLTIINAISKIELDRNIFWSGNKEYIHLINAHKVAMYRDTPNIGHKYPVPLFFDKHNYAYFNCLNNYIIERSYYLKNDRERKDPLLKQIFDNSFMSWDSAYIPKLKYFDYTKYNHWTKSVRFYDNKKYIVVIPESKSKHGLRCLSWTHDDILGLTAMMRQFDINVVVCTKDKGKYYNSSIFVSDDEFCNIFPLIENAYIVLSEDIDYLLLSLMVSDAKVFINSLSEIKRTAFDIYKNAEYLNCENMIYSSESLKPIDVYMSEGL
jgi:hypothetical protein